MYNIFHFKLWSRHMYSIGLTGPSLRKAFAWVITFISNVWVAELSTAEEHSVFTLYTQAASAASKRAAGKIRVSPSGSNLSITERHVTLLTHLHGSYPYCLSSNAAFTEISTINLTSLFSLPNHFFCPFSGHILSNFQWLLVLVH